MNIVLITPTPPDINAFGIRTLSSVLKQTGFDTKSIFLPGGIELLHFDGSYRYKYSEKILKQIAELCSDAALIGVSFMSHYLDRAIQITNYLKEKLNTPIVWGGTHPTYRPEESLEFCDIVCIGEGEYPIVTLVEKIFNGKEYTDIQGCWYRNNGKIQKNEIGAIVQNLDEIPYLDYDLHDHYVLDCKDDSIIPMNDEVMKEQFLKTPYFKNKNLFTYRTLTSRGCPHRCSYCASSAMMKLRRRSVDNVIGELEKILAQFGYIELISFFDDTYFAAPVEYFEEFRDKYKSRIGLPFHAQCSPNTINEKKMDLLVDAGLYHTEMGVQTGSEKIRKIYRRTESNQQIVATAELINKYSSKMLPPYYHIIVDNPWETTEDVKETLELILKLPRKSKLSISSLILFPGTELNERAKKEGLLEDELNEVCRRPFTFPKGTYLNFLIYLSGFSFVPRSLLKLLSKDLFVNSFHTQNPKRFYDLLFSLTHKLRIIGRGIRAVFAGDFERIANFVQSYRLTGGRSLHGR